MKYIELISSENELILYSIEWETVLREDRYLFLKKVNHNELVFPVIVNTRGEEEIYEEIEDDSLWHELCTLYETHFGISEM